MVEGAKRKKTPNEIALDILLAGLTIIFLLVTVTLLADLAVRGRARPGRGTPVTLTVLVALLVCLIPTTIGGLLSAIGIAGMDRMIQANVIATSGRAVEAAGDVDTLLLDKTGTITHGNRQATAFLPAKGVTEAELAEAAAAGVARRRHARGQEHRRARRRRCSGARSTAPAGATSIAVHRADPDERRRLRRRAGGSARVRATRSRATSHGARRRGCRAEVKAQVDAVAKQGATPLVVADGGTRARRRPARRRRQDGHPRAVRRDARAWASRP